MNVGENRPAPQAATTVVPTAHIAGNAEVFPLILARHVPKGALVADVTYGRGVFWRRVPPGDYRLVASDLATGVDCRRLPYPDHSFDALVLDPPYMEGLLREQPEHRPGRGAYAPFRRRYAGGRETGGGAKWHDAVVELYVAAGAEAGRVLRPGGVLIVKCQDEVSANRQRLTHVEIINHYERFGFQVKDLFIVVRPNRAGVSRMKRQVHARKNHSYFIVFETPSGR